MKFDEIENLTAEQLENLYDDIIQQEILADCPPPGGCASGCTLGSSYVSCTFFYGTASYNTYGHDGYYTSCQDGTIATGYWNGGGYYNAVCKWAIEAWQNAHR